MHSPMRKHFVFLPVATCIILVHGLVNTSTPVMSILSVPSSYFSPMTATAWAHRGYALKTCPPGVPTIELNPTQHESSMGPRGSMVPRVYAEPLQMAHPIKSSKNGTWSTDGRVWSLCVLGPSGIKSLTFLFTRLKLYPGETLEIRSLDFDDNYAGGAVSHQVFTAWSPGSGAPNRVSAPIAGGHALLTLTKGISAFNDRTSMNLNQIKISAVLQGVRDIFASKDAAINASVGHHPTAPPESEVTPNLNITDVLADSINDKKGYGLACLKDAGCYKQWHNATQATVLLLLTSPAGGRTCTGALIAGPDPADQLIATANHCREDDDPLTIATLWAAVFKWGGNCPMSTTDVEYLGASQVLTGLEIVWSDEYSDVMILRLKNEIPSSFAPYYMGWDASTFPLALDGSGTVHYAGGGPYKKLTTTSLFLKPEQWKTKQYTHVVASWTDGVTQEGSSGATLVDMSSGLGIGVLTGGPEPSTCKQGADMFGTFYAAFQNGLGDVLAGKTNKTKSLGIIPMDDGPGIILDLSEIILTYRPLMTQVTWMELSDAPLQGETLTATLTSTVPSQASPFVVYPKAINFTSLNWNVSRPIFITVQNTSEIDFPQAFQVEIVLTSDKNAKFRKIRMAQGICVSTEAPAGFSSTFPVLISGGSNGIDANDTGSLVERSGQSSFLVNPGDLLSVEGNPLGSVMYYNLSAGETVELNIAVCGRPAPLQVVVYNDSRATWLSTTDCSSNEAPNCLSVDTMNGCSGFLSLVLPGVQNFPPYTITVSTQNGLAVQYLFKIVQISQQGQLFSNATAPAG